MVAAGSWKQETLEKLAMERNKKEKILKDICCSSNAAEIKMERMYVNRRPKDAPSDTQGHLSRPLPLYFLLFQRKWGGVLKWIWILQYCTTCWEGENLEGRKRNWGRRAKDTVFTSFFKWVSDFIPVSINNHTVNCWIIFISSMAIKNLSMFLNYFGLPV